MTCGMFRALLDDPRPLSEATAAERFAMRHHCEQCQECFDLVVEGYRRHRAVDPRGAEAEAEAARRLHAEHDLPIGED